MLLQPLLFGEKLLLLPFLLGGALCLGGLEFRPLLFFNALLLRKQFMPGGFLLGQALGLGFRNGNRRQG